MLSCDKESSASERWELQTCTCVLSAVRLRATPGSSTKAMRRQQYLLILLLLCAAPSRPHSSPQDDSFVAAVAEMAAVSGGSDWQTTLRQNLALADELIATAAMHGADLLVLPEAALLGIGAPKEAAVAVPAPDQHALPCDRSDALEILRRLSCSARNASLYLVANLIEVVSCSGDGCPDTGVLYHNTDIALDRRGEVVGRYRKFNLFIEPMMSPTQTPEFSFFDTDFGVRFGMFTCFDILFERPAAELAHRMGIRHFVFPTAWYSQVPFLTARQAQSGWAAALNVTLLAAGYNLPVKGRSGSGVYVGAAGPWVSVQPEQLGTTLILMDTPKFPQPGYEARMVPVILELGQSNRTHSSGLKLAHEDLSSYVATLLNISDYRPQPGGNVLEQDVTAHACDGAFCCELEARVAMNPTLEDQALWRQEAQYRARYWLVARNGQRSFMQVRSGAIQVCALIACPDDTLTKCGSFPACDPNDVIISRVNFPKLRVSGTFDRFALRMPSTLLADLGSLEPTQYQVTEASVDDGEQVDVNMTTYARDADIVTFGVYARDFPRDEVPLVDEEPSVTMI